MRGQKETGTFLFDYHTDFDDKCLRLFKCGTGSENSKTDIYF